MRRRLRRLSVWFEDDLRRRTMYIVGTWQCSVGRYLDKRMPGGPFNGLPRWIYQVCQSGQVRSDAKLLHYIL